MIEVLSTNDQRLNERQMSPNGLTRLGRVYAIAVDMDIESLRLI